MNVYGPHSPNHTRGVAETFAEGVRVLNHATAGSDGLAYAADVYDVLGCLAAGVAGLDQTARQLARFLDGQLEAQRLAVTAGRYAGKPDAAVAAANQHLSAARVAAGQLADALDRAQQALSEVSARTDGER